MEVLDSLFQACIEQLPVDMHRLSSRSHAVIHAASVDAFWYISNRSCEQLGSCLTGLVKRTKYGR